MCVCVLDVGVCVRGVWEQVGAFFNLFLHSIDLANGRSKSCETQEHKK